MDVAPGRLRLSNDRKVTTVAHWTPSKGWEPGLHNTFGIPAGITCPGATMGDGGCHKVCYARKLERMPWLASLRKLLAHNWELLEHASYHEMVRLLRWLMEDFRVSHAKAVKKYGDFPLKFRIHYDGDYFSVLYAQAWARIIRENPDIQFWSYTRSFIPECNVIPVLHGAANHALYLSVDPVNKKLAALRLAEHPDIKLAFMDRTFDGAQEVAVELTGKRQAKCPEGWKTPLIDARGGACESCGLCITGRRSLLFSTSDT